MATNLEDWDHAHGFLLGAALPLVLTPPGSGLPPRPRLRGVVRVDDEHSRLALSHDPSMATGVAVELSLPSLYRDGCLHDVDAVLAYVRTTMAARLDPAAQDTTLRRDSHANALIALSDAERAQAFTAVLPEQELFRLFNLLHHGPMQMSVQDVYTFTGFMLRADQRCRIYVRLTDTRTSYGLEIPLRTSGGDSIFGIGASFGQELAMKLGCDGRLFEPVVDDADEYCKLVYDLQSWVNPPQD
ncbi:hypothetical protein AB0I37_13750 [Micromonospora purpureochromogenes]|uniref:hypothetical protein n=1 Tax=Micromonospora purpureochromogenes TaxID=47872 RepID=UPI0033DB8A0B